MRYERFINLNFKQNCIIEGVKHSEQLLNLHKS